VVVVSSDWRQYALVSQRFLKSLLPDVLDRGRGHRPAPHDGSWRSTVSASCRRLKAGRAHIQLLQALFEKLGRQVPS
jgi:hypothetical protein